MTLTSGKIFGVGLSKTGTSSLAQALQILGYKTLDNMGANRYMAGDLLSIDMATVEAHEALTDTPIPSFYRELDERYPGSRFILTVRDRDGWLKSCMKQFSPRFAEVQSEPNRRLFEDLYGTNVFDAQKFTAGYERFVAGVHEYFKDRPDDLLVLNVTAGEGWEKLCPFLGEAVPDIPFPKANVTHIRWMKMEDLVAVAEEAGRALLQRYQGGLAPDAHGTLGRKPALGLRLLDRAMKAALGRDVTEAAALSAYNVISVGLRKLGAEIPILSPIEQAAPYDERKRWNHVWLVDPLDGKEAFAAGRSDFSVNIALIEDGRPIYGVVHAPAKGMTYYGRTGKGAFRRRADDAAVRLAPSAMPQSSQAGARSGSRQGSSMALSICAMLSSPTSSTPSFGPAMEWDLAAADAVVSATGMRLCDRGSQDELSYNSEILAKAGGGVCPRLGRATAAPAATP